MQKSIKAIEQTGTHVVAISYDPQPAIAKFAQRNQITYTLLSDPNSEVIKLFGIYNENANPRIKGIPYPGTFILDEKGIVRAKIFRDGYRDRHSPEELIKAVKSIK